MSDLDSNSSFKCYNFVVASHDLDLDSPNVRVSSPDFAVLLDHTIGVIWKLFNKDSDVKFLDQYHLIWALKFLEGIQPSGGHGSKDVKLLKLLIRSLLVSEYAGSEVVKPKPLEKAPEKSVTGEVQKEEMNVRDGDEDLNQGFVEDQDSHLHSFPEDPWYANRIFPSTFSAIEDNSSESPEAGGLINKIFGIFGK